MNTLSSDWLDENPDYTCSCGLPVRCSCFEVNGSSNVRSVSRTRSREYLKAMKVTTANNLCVAEHELRHALFGVQLVHGTEGIVPPLNSADPVEFRIRGTPELKITVSTAADGTPTSEVEGQKLRVGDDVARRLLAQCKEWDTEWL